MIALQVVSHSDPTESFVGALPAENLKRFIETNVLTPHFLNII